MTETGHAIRNAKQALQTGQEQQAIAHIKSAIESIAEDLLAELKVPDTTADNGTRSRQLRAAEGTLRKVLFKVEAGSQQVIAVNGLSFALFHLGHV